jgi:CheY-like chemotaxis protein
VTLHGGTVSAHSEGLRRGSEFLVRIPLSGSTDSMQRVELRSDRAAAPPKVSRRVLVVDDNRDAAEVLAETLRVYGHEARLAFDGPGALDVAASFHPEVALLDIGLPVMDGYELARRLRELPEGRSMRLIAVTGYGQESDRRRSREAGFDRHLVKPIDVTTLDSLIEQLFRGSDVPPPSSVG